MKIDIKLLIAYLTDNISEITTMLNELEERLITMQDVVDSNKLSDLDNVNSLLTLDQDTYEDLVAWGEMNGFFDE